MLYRAFPFLSFLLLFFLVPASFSRFIYFSPLSRSSTKLFLVTEYIPHGRSSSPPPQQPSTSRSFLLTGLLPLHRFPLLFQRHCLFFLDVMDVFLDVFFGCFWIFHSFHIGPRVGTHTHIGPSGITYMHKYYNNKRDYL